MKDLKFLVAPMAATCVLLAAAGCHTDMWIQPKVKPQGKSDFFSDKMGSRMPVPGTVPFKSHGTNTAFMTGYENGKLVAEFPIPVTEELIRRGQERFGVFCSHCHGAAGDGQGMIAQRGFTLQRPVGNYHTDRLREMPVGHFFDVITNGYGTMFPFKARIEPQDRWAIASYIRALQLSQHAPEAVVPAAELARMASGAPAEPAAAPAGGGH